MGMKREGDSASAMRVTAAAAATLVLGLGLVSPAARGARAEHRRIARVGGCGGVRLRAAASVPGRLTGL